MLPTIWKTLCFPSTIKVDKHSFWSYQNHFNSGSRYSCWLWLSELPNIRKTLCFLSTVWVENCSFQSYLEKWRCYDFRHSSQLTTIAFRAILKIKYIITSLFSSKLPLLLFLLWVTQSLLKTTELKPFRTFVVKLRYSLL